MRIYFYPVNPGKRPAAGVQEECPRRISMSNVTIFRAQLRTLLAPLPRVSSALLVQSALGMVLALPLAYIAYSFKINLAIANLLYLLLIVSFAVYFGFLQASVLSLAAVLCENYFLTPPLFHFRIADSNNVIVLALFEITAIVVSRVSAREKAAGQENLHHRMKVQRLYAVSRGALLLNLDDGPEQQMASLILGEFQLDAVAIYNSELGSIGTAGTWASKTEELRHRLEIGSFLAQGTYVGAVESNLRTAECRNGTLLVLGNIQQIALESLASLVSLTLDRHHAFVKQGAAEAARHTEQLRGAVLDNLAHAFKTPLTVIRAASSGLLEIGNLDELQTDLTRMIDEQSERLNELATRLLQTARIETASLTLQREHIEVEELLRDVVGNFQRESTRGLDGRPSPSRIDVNVSARMPTLSADYEMLHSILTELLDNAAKYSDIARPISLTASHNGQEFLLSVHSWGDVIDVEDRERIFERFYRSRGHRHSAPGTGIGLAVARRTAEAHAGHIWVTSSEREGTTFHIALPPADPEDQLQSSTRKQPLEHC